MHGLLTIFEERKRLRQCKGDLVLFHWIFSDALFVLRTTMQSSSQDKGKVVSSAAFSHVIEKGFPCFAVLRIFRIKVSCTYPLLASQARSLTWCEMALWSMRMLLRAMLLSNGSSRKADETFLSNVLVSPRDLQRSEPFLLHVKGWCTRTYGPCLLSRGLSQGPMNRALFLLGPTVPARFTLQAKGVLSILDDVRQRDHGPCGLSQRAMLLSIKSSRKSEMTWLISAILISLCQYNVISEGWQQATFMTKDSIGPLVHGINSMGYSEGHTVQASREAADVSKCLLDFL